MKDWFKNIFSQHDQEEFYEEEEIIEQQPLVVEQPRTVVRDRRFRFPIVPDHKEGENTRQESDLLINKKKLKFSNPYAYETEQPREEVKVEIPVPPQEEPKPIKKEKKTVVHKKETEPKKPFRLTEVPSAIHGYRKPVEEKKDNNSQAPSYIQQTEIDMLLRKNREAFYPKSETEQMNTAEQEKEGVIEFELPSVLSFIEELGIISLEQPELEEEFEQAPQPELEEEFEQAPQSKLEEEFEQALQPELEEFEQALQPELEEFEQAPQSELEEEFEQAPQSELEEEFEQAPQSELEEEFEQTLQSELEGESSNPVLVEQVEVAGVKVDILQSSKEQQIEDQKYKIENNIQIHVHPASEIVHSEEKQEREEQASVISKRRHVPPVNVMMLREDREAVLKKKTEEPNGKVEITNSEEKKQEVVEAIVPSPEAKVAPVVEDEIISIESEGTPTTEITSPILSPEESVMTEETPNLEQVQVIEEKQEKQEKQEIVLSRYDFPSMDDLEAVNHVNSFDDTWIKEQWELLDTAFYNFNVGAKVINVTQGPAVTRFEVQPEPGVKVNKITNLSDDIKLNLSAKDIRIEAPIPGRNAVGIEVPNKKSNPVFLREILESDTFRKNESPLTIALGLDISGEPIIADIRKMPHGLIAGATGSGKSVCINSLLVSVLYKATPQEVKLLLIDPKMVELAPYNHIPHLVSPVITDAKAATGALKWAVEEMDRRYQLFAHAGARDLSRYNELALRHNQETLPYLVIVIDELADLMMVAPGDVEEAICRIAQKARACGIHLIVATQRPSVDVITGLIKANIPTRIAFTVSSQVDSRTIIDINGAEKLLGRGDMLFLNNGESKPVRVQGCYVSDDEIERVVEHAKKQMPPNYLFQQEELLTKVEPVEADDELFLEACEFVVEQGGASASMLQRRFRLGFNRAARLIDLMESRGIISEAKGSKPREVLITLDEIIQMIKE